MGQSTLRQKIHAGLGPVAIRFGPGATHWRFRPRDLDVYLNANVVPPVIEPPPLSPSIEARRRKAREAREAREAEAAAKAAPKSKRRTRVREVA